jgi:hypothetical protein
MKKRGSVERNKSKEKKKKIKLTVFMDVFGFACGGTPHR